MFQKTFNIPVVITALLQLYKVSGVHEYVQLQPISGRDFIYEFRKKPVHNKRDDHVYNEAKLFENIQESWATQTSKPVTSNNYKDDNIKTLKEIKVVLEQLLDKLNNMENKYYKNQLSSKIYATTSYTTQTGYENTKPVTTLLDVKKRNGHNTVRSKPRWGQWTSWSACSVTCGKGREIRWRHCLEDCETAETEMEEKACQLPACGPGKIFGIQL